MEKRTLMRIPTSLKNCFMILVFSLLLFGCGKVEEDNSPTLALIGEQRVSLSDFNKRISHLPERYRRLARKHKKEYLEEFINDTLLYQEALREGIDQDEEVQRVIEEARRKIIIARFLKDQIDDKVSVGNEEIQEHYQANRDDFMNPEILRLSHILVPSEEEAKKLLSRLREGEDFASLARAKSIDPTAQQGGDIGHFPKGQLMPEFEKVCAALDVGDISGVTKTSLGYHIIMLTDRRPPQALPVEQVEDRIRDRLYIYQKQRMLDDMLFRLREENLVEVNKGILFPDEEKTSD